jgi:hypothetical protein
MLSSTCNAARANLAAELPAAVLDQLLTIDINTAIAGPASLSTTGPPYLAGACCHHCLKITRPAA